MFFLFTTALDVRSSGHNLVCQKKFFQSLAQFFWYISDMSIIDENFDCIFIIQIFGFKI